MRISENKMLRKIIKSLLSYIEKLEFENKSKDISLDYYRDEMKKIKEQQDEQ